MARDGLSVADAHVGASVLFAGWDDAIVLTSDPDDMRRVRTPVAMATCTTVEEAGPVSRATKVRSDREGLIDLSGDGLR